MSYDDIRQHIQAAARHQSPGSHRMASRMVRACWPGGAEDRTEPFARGWLSPLASHDGLGDAPRLLMCQRTLRGL